MQWLLGLTVIVLAAPSARGDATAPEPSNGNWEARCLRALHGARDESVKLEPRLASIEIATRDVWWGKVVGLSYDADGWLVRAQIAGPGVCDSPKGPPCGPSEWRVMSFAETARPGDEEGPLRTEFSRRMNLGIYLRIAERSLARVSELFRAAFEQCIDASRRKKG